MTSGSHPFFTLDIGSASIGAALVARIDGRWRLLASTVAPAAVGIDPLLSHLAEAVAAADGTLLAGTSGWREWARVESRTLPGARVVVAGSSDGTVDPLAHAFKTDGWQTTACMTPERAVVLEAALALREPDLDLVVIAAPGSRFRRTATRSRSPARSTIPASSPSPPRAAPSRSSAPSSTTGRSSPRTGRRSSSPATPRAPAPMTTRTLRSIRRTSTRTSCGR